MGLVSWLQATTLAVQRHRRGDSFLFYRGANVDDRDSRVWEVFTKELYGKVFADRGYIKQELFERLFDQGDPSRAWAQSQYEE